MDLVPLISKLHWLVNTYVENSCVRITFYLVHITQDIYSKHMFSKKLVYIINIHMKYIHIGVKYDFTE